MARIRTIKPEFWTDEKIIDLPYEARLLFIGIWNFCDDDGFLWDEPARIKMQVLPDDDIDAFDLVDLLVAAGFLERFVTEDYDVILHVKNFRDHQKVSNPAPSKLSLLTYKKSTITLASRRAVALKYGCQPGEKKVAECYYCGSAGTIRWWKKKNGSPSSWISFSKLELEHMEPEVNGGQQDNNLVLACRNCNRSKGDKNVFWFVLRKSDSSREVSLEGKGIEKEQEQEGKHKGASALAIPDWIPQETWNDFTEMRKKLRKPLTTKAAELIIAKLDRLRAVGHSPADVLNQSIEMGWQGVFELKSKGFGNVAASNKPSILEQIRRAREANV